MRAGLYIQHFTRYLCQKTEANDVLNAILGLGQLVSFADNTEERYLFHLIILRLYFTKYVLIQRNF